MVADFSHQLVGELIYPLYGEPFFLLAAITLSYKPYKKSMRWSFNDSKK